MSLLRLMLSLKGCWELSLVRLMLLLILFSILGF